MFVVKRDGRKEAVAFDKITARISKLCYGLDPKYVEPVIIAQKASKSVLCVCAFVSVLLGLCFDTAIPVRGLVEDGIISYAFRTGIQYYDSLENPL